MFTESTFLGWLGSALGKAASEAVGRWLLHFVGIALLGVGWLVVNNAASLPWNYIAPVLFAAVVVCALRREIYWRKTVQTIQNTEHRLVEEGQAFRSIAGELERVIGDPVGQEMFGGTRKRILFHRLRDEFGIPIPMTDPNARTGSVEYDRLLQLVAASKAGDLERARSLYREGVSK